MGIRQRPTVASARRRAEEIYPRVRPDEPGAEVAALRAEIVGDPRRRVAGQFPIEAVDGTLEGPFGLFLFSPSVGEPLHVLGGRIRTATSLSPRRRELAILAVAGASASRFEEIAHRPLATQAGLSAAEIDAALSGSRIGDQAEDALIAFCRASVAEVSPGAEFVALRRHFDRRAVFEVCALVAYYRGLATMLSLFGIADPGA